MDGVSLLLVSPLQVSEGDLKNGITTPSTIERACDNSKVSYVVHILRLGPLGSWIVLWQAPLTTLIPSSEW